MNGEPDRSRSIGAAGVASSGSRLMNVSQPSGSRPRSLNPASPSARRSGSRSWRIAASSACSPRPNWRPNAR
ncbi:hypothetical protein G6F40_017249 [Rhizopus arrhizus]|nr:hypothetical protein G6F40_017249 [Rhizopus arrhizus]KAG1388819.1 hypothetical protein G6F58_013422 [Rhizopus delemar]